MTILQAIVLGLVQGLTEFIPISSSAHLELTPWILGWEEDGLVGSLAFDVFLHLGTLVAVLAYFRSDWIAHARGTLEAVRRAFSVARSVGAGDRMAVAAIALEWLAWSLGKPDADSVLLCKEALAALSAALRRRGSGGRRLLRRSAPRLLAPRRDDFHPRGSARDGQWPEGRRRAMRLWRRRWIERCVSRTW